MPYKGPHISIKSESLVNRILHINFDEFEDWPEGVRRLTIEISEELFMVRYNPFINPDTVRESVSKSFEQARRGLSMHYANTISEGITMFWSAHDSDLAFRKEIISRLAEVISKSSIDTRAASRVENATDATDLRLELPLLVVTPASAEEVSAIVRVANDMHFAIIPRGGGSGFTGGAIPARKRSVIVSLTKLTMIKEVNTKNMTLTVEAGVITIDAIRAAAAKNMLFSVDPASKTASSIGGNVAENSGGPLAVEYGTTIDNILSYRMVLPTGEIIEVTRKNHPRRKIEENDEAIFGVRDISGGLRSVIKLKGSELRKPGLGKDVTNKTLGGLPGVQKEGVDGIITETTFVLHPKLKHHRVIVVEFYGASMHNAALAINDIIALRDKFRAAGDLVKLTMLEEFNSKYVQAIDYKKKSSQYEGHPISVLTIQVDSDDENALDQGAKDVVAACTPYDGVDSFVARDDKEGEFFWEDRHKLSAIAKRTSGFKINEDIVIPLAALPEFSLYLEELNVEYMARAYRRALQAVGRLRGVADDDKEFNREFTYASKIIKGEYPKGDPGAERLSDQELQLHAVLYLKKLKGIYTELALKIEQIEDHMLKSQIVVASHMHAGDGNCHVNMPVNSGDVDMVAEGFEVADKVMQKAKDLGGAVTGEHGIGITKIAFQDDERIKELREYKQLIDPANIVNPAKLTQKDLPVSSFTFSFNKLIQDLEQSGLPDKERLIELLRKVQICTRCGKCKEVCSMHYPEKDMLYYPRNRNMSLGALIEAIYYSQVNSGKIDPALMRELSGMMEHCTVCGKCTAVCPVKISSEEVTLTLRSFVESEGFGGHPFKDKVINYMAKDTAGRFPKAAKLASVGQKTANRFLPMVPHGIRDKFYNPIFNAPGPIVGYRNLYEGLKLDKGSIFVPQGEVRGTVLYFPGCGGSLFYRSVGLGGVSLLLSVGYAVVMPPELLCCGFPALVAGLQDVFAQNQDNNITKLRELSEKSARLGYPVSTVLTSCGSCRDGLERHFITEVLDKANGDAADGQSVPLAKVALQDVFQFLTSVLPGKSAQKSSRANVIYHAPCHAEWSGVAKQKAPAAYAKALENFVGVKPVTAPGCCAESGTGGITSPLVYNKLRIRKKVNLENAIPLAEKDAPVIVGCPSCRMGIMRTLMGMKDKRPVLHTLEFLADKKFGKDWRGRVRKLVGAAPADKDGLRKVNMGSLAAISVASNECEPDD